MLTCLFTQQRDLSPKYISGIRIFISTYTAKRDVESFINASSCNKLIVTQNASSSELYGRLVAARSGHYKSHVGGLSVNSESCGANSRILGALLRNSRFVCFSEMVRRAVTKKNP